eukprot:TRINITY_DN106914_c0_g1_i1.p1 TRINITY_DN106914_c0_g1~~TRINITY_DN106914_c0_g1_i1.p1  ORF type:complete len:456 (-),score=81.66 TRINITY_DN106914_c0_g1_i1:252-1619(-)
MLMKEEILLEPYGFPHKRIGKMMLPAFVQASAVAGLKESWTPPEDYTVVALTCGFSPFHGPGLGCLVALAEQWTPDKIQEEILGHQLPSPAQIESAIRSASHNWHDLKPPVECAAMFQRCLEFRASQGSIAAQEGMGNHCAFITRLPPSFLPDSAVGDALVRQQRYRWSDVESGDDLEMRETNLIGHLPLDCDAIRQNNGKIVVLSADPRYLAMREITFMSQLQSWHPVSKPPPDAGQYLNSALRNNLLTSLSSVTEWAGVERRQPSHVRIFFIEDLLLEPATTLFGMAEFLGLQQNAATLDKLTQELEVFVQQRKGLFTSCKEGLTEIGLMRNFVQQFESLCAAMPNKAAAAWADQISVLVQLGQSRRRLSCISSVSQSQPGMESWRAAHEAGTCRPCIYAARGGCRSATSCRFCHGPHEPIKSSRPSKRERERRDRRRAALRLRTPSPDGLSS